MPAVSKKQQKFFGIVRAIQKGEIAPTTPETAKVASDMKKKDVKDIASTKHKGLPEKKRVNEEYTYKHKEKILKKTKKFHDALFKDLHKKHMDGDVNETSYYRNDSKYKKRLDDGDRINKQKNLRMKYGKRWKEFTKDVSAAKDRLRPGEVRRYDKKLNKWISNKD